MSTVEVIQGIELELMLLLDYVAVLQASSTASESVSWVAGLDPGCCIPNPSLFGVGYSVKLLQRPHMSLRVLVRDPLIAEYLRLEEIERSGSQQAERLISYYASSRTTPSRPSVDVMSVRAKLGVAYSP